MMTTVAIAFRFGLASTTERASGANLPRASPRPAPPLHRRHGGLRGHLPCHVSLAEAVRRHPHEGIVGLAVVVGRGHRGRDVDLSRVDRLLPLLRRGVERLGHLQQLGCSQAQSVSSCAGVLALFDVDLLLLVLYEEVILTRFGFSSNAIFDKQLLLELLPVNYGNA